MFPGLVPIISGLFCWQSAGFGGRQEILMASKAKKDDQIRAALYARVSTTGHGQDVGLQVDEFKAVAEQRGWTVVGEFVDDGYSGCQTDRPALARMLEVAKAGKVDIVCVWKLDRLGRSLKHLLQTLDELSRLGVGFFSARDAGIDSTTPQGRLMTQLLGAFAEF